MADDCSSNHSGATSPRSLNDSWVELTSSFGESSPTPSLVKMLGDAQKESGQVSPKSTGTNSSKSSLESPPLSANSGSYGRDATQSHTVQVEQLTERIRDWSSRPEIVPPSDYGLKHDYEQPIKKKKHPLSVRNTRVMKDDWFSTTSISTLFITHSACIVIGLLVGFYCNRSPRVIRG
ncbi:BCL2/adenovirus E1B 19 kDa protein-interacting protein 3-like [Watersipora subatra]|uniref:BCL2/adenovirus E1B 19 kDa protein-interacting protein 3-like n=1 Tax=Watersipora subatra TaxID=2589382 RepID=UPI00355B6058